MVASTLQYPPAFGFKTRDSNAYRGLIELFSCGLILLIPDLLMWAYRANSVQLTEFKYKD